MTQNMNYYRVNQFFVEFWRNQTCLCRSLIFFNIMSKNDKDGEEPKVNDYAYGEPLSPEILSRRFTVPVNTKLRRGLSLSTDKSMSYVSYLLAFFVCHAQQWWSLIERGSFLWFAPTHIWKRLRLKELTSKFITFRRIEQTSMIK